MESWKSVPLDEVSFTPRPFHLSDGQYAILEKAYGKTIKPAARKTLAGVIVRYLDDRAEQKSTETWGHVSDHLEAFATAVTPLWRYSYGKKTGMAYRRFRAMLQRALATDPVRIDLERDELIVTTRANGAKPFNSLSIPAPTGGFSIALSEQTVQRIAASLAHAIALVRADIVKQAKLGSLDTEPSELDLFFVNLSDWAKKNKLGYGAYDDGQFPSAFSGFVLELLNMLPEDLRNPIKLKSAGAIAKRIKKAKSKLGKQPKKDQSRLLDEE